MGLSGFGADWQQTVIGALLVSGLFSVIIRRLELTTVVLAGQGLLLTALVWSEATRLADPLAWWVVAVTFLVRVVGIPSLIRWTIWNLQIEVDAQSALTRKAALPIAVGLVMASQVVAAPLAAFKPALGDDAIATALALIFLGLFTMIKRRKAPHMVVAIVTIDNGVFLAAAAVTHGLPLIVETFAALVTIAGVFVGALMVRAIHDDRGRVNVDHLTALRG